MTAPASVPGEFFVNASERRAFECFRDQLRPAGWTIAHNLYVSRRAERGARARELDLLLMHPEHGVVLVEVKGGKVEARDDGRWYQNGDQMRRDPDDQASSALRVVRDAIREHPALGRVGVEPPTGWMLCLTDSSATPSMRAKLDRSMAFAADQLIDTADLSRPRGVRDAIDRFASRIDGGRAPGSPGPEDAAPGWVLDLLDALMPTLKFSTSLIGDLEVDQARLQADERLHQDWVENLGGLPRLHFEAGAGGGKSVIARLRALSLARSGRRVLLVCSTASLAKSFQRDVQEHASGKVVANTLHQTLVLQARKTGRSEDFGVPSAGALTPDQLTALPGNIAAIAAASRDRFDALVVDEAQDMGRQIVGALSGFLATPEGSVWTFADSFQRFNVERFDPTNDELRSNDQVPAAAGADVVLIRQNHRNPEPVFRLAEGLRADGVQRVSRKGELSSYRIDYRECDSAEGQREVLEQLMEELAEQYIPPGRIAVVTMGKTENNPVFRERRFKGKLSRFMELANPQLDLDGRRVPSPVEDLPAPHPDKVYFDSARRMKGLERGVVILVDVPDPGPVGSIDRRLLYAGVTRATTYLAVIASRERVGALKALAAVGRA